MYEPATQREEILRKRYGMSVAVIDGDAYK
jgi:hypothetical protein